MAGDEQMEKAAHNVMLVAMASTRYRNANDPQAVPGIQVQTLKWNVFGRGTRSIHSDISDAKNKNCRNVLDNAGIACGIS
jgi:hypothetical protein